MARGKRKSGDGTVRLRKDGRWEGRIIIGYDENNLPKTKNVLAKTKSECIEKLEQLKSICIVSTSDNCKSDMSFGEWMDFWYRTYSKPKLRSTTQQGYENHIYKHIIPTLGQIPLNQLSQNDLQQFYAKLKTNGRITRTDIYGNGLSDRSIRACHACCRSALDKAVSERLIKSNPAEDCKLPPKKSKGMQILTPAEMQWLLIQAKEEGFYEMFLLDLATGMRRGELLALQWDDINFQTGKLRISKQVRFENGNMLLSTPKTKASIRTIILPQSILNILQEYQCTVNSRWLFPSPVKRDAPRDPTACRKKLSQILEHADCKHVRFHDLRHTFATTALEHGMDMKTLASTMGHSTVATALDIYTHTTDAMRIEAANKIDRKIGGVKPTAENQASTNAKQEKPTAGKFEPFVGKVRKRGTGCISQINDHLWEGRYSQRINGKRTSKNVYAQTRDECELKLAELIQAMKAEKAAGCTA